MPAFYPRWRGGGKGEPERGAKSLFPLPSPRPPGYDRGMLKWNRFVGEECGHHFESNWLLRYCCPKCNHFAFAGSMKPTIIGFWIFVGLLILLTILAGMGFFPRAP